MKRSAQNQNCTDCTFDSRRNDADLELQLFESNKMKALKKQTRNFLVENYVNHAIISGGIKQGGPKAQF